MSEPAGSSIRDLLLDHAVIQAALRRAFQEVVRKHAQAGVPMAAWQEGKVVWVSAEEILDRFSGESSR